jgi:hypothetical protein
MRALMVRLVDPGGGPSNRTAQLNEQNCAEGYAAAQNSLHFHAKAI